MTILNSSCRVMGFLVLASQLTSQTAFGFAVHPSSFPTSCASPLGRHGGAAKGLGASKQSTDGKDSAEKSESVPGVRFLGRGPNAIVRPGCVLVAPSNEFHHYYRRSAIFIHAMGEEENDGNDLHEVQYIIRGLIIDHPTPFTLSEMMEDNPIVPNNPLGGNFLFRGGDKGKEGVILLHDQEDLSPEGAVGDSGVYQGGWQGALQECANGSKSVDSFKAFFNYCEFTEQELEDLLDSQEDGDAWVSVEVKPEFVLDPDWDRGDAWKRLRNTIKQMNI